MDINKLHEYGIEFKDRLCLRSFPLAVKLLKKEADIPKNTKRPKDDFGYRMSLCQGYAMSRRDGTPITMLKEDMWCFEPVIGYGLAEPPEQFLKGYNRFPEDVETLEAGSHYAEEFPRFQIGKYMGITSAPLFTVNFIPDLVIFYCDSIQLNSLLLGLEYRDGYGITCHLSSHAACVYTVVPLMQTGQCQVAVPCRGDHYQAMAGDDEVIFAAPKSKLVDILDGLRHCDKYGWRLPRNHYMACEPEQRESYMKIGRMAGMDI